MNAMPLKRGQMLLSKARGFSGLLTRVASGESTGGAVWHNKTPAASSEPAADIDQDPNLRHMYTDNAGVRLHYVTSGSDRNPLMVFVHGFPDFWYSWRNQIQAFSASHQVVALDLRGYNLSDRPEGIEQYKFSVLLDDIRAVIEAERNGRKVILVGHDWGAALSWLFTGQNPDLIERLVVLSIPHPGAITKELSLCNHPVAQSRASAYATQFFARGKGDGLTAEELAYWIAHPQVKRRYIEAFQKSSVSSMMSYYKSNYSFSRVARNLFDPAMKRLFGAKIKCPTLHVHGIEETHALLSTLDVERAWMENPDSLTVEVVPGVGHFIQHEVPGYLNQTISSWLKDSTSLVSSGEGAPRRSKRARETSASGS
jgi:pimeloyl-ACP methyl ester carboxylesterase